MGRFCSILGRALAAFFYFSFSLFACDGVSPTCPATLEPRNKWKAVCASVSCPTLPIGYVFNTPYEAADAACSAMKNLLLTWNNASHDYRNPQCYISVSTNTNVMYVSSGYAEHWVRDIPDDLHPWYKVSNYGFTVQSNGPQIIESYSCDNPTYPDGPDEAHLCHLDLCSGVAGQNRKSFYNEETGESASIATDGPDYQSTLCLEVSGQHCEAKTFGLGMCTLGVVGHEQCGYEGATFTGAKCDTVEFENPASYNEGVENPVGKDAPSSPCITGADGRRVCGTATDSNGSNSEVGDLCVVDSYGKNICVNVDAPQENCIQNSDKIQCNNPQPTNCGYVSGVYTCVIAESNCGNFNGRNVCVNADGSTDPWDGVTQGTDNGAPGGAGSGSGTPSGSGQSNFEDVPDLDVNNTTGDTPTLETPDNIDGWDDYKNSLNESAPSDVSGFFSSLINPFAGVAGPACCSMVMDLGPKIGSHTISGPDWFFAGIRYLVNLILGVLAINRIVQRVQEVF